MIRISNKVVEVMMKRQVLFQNAMIVFPACLLIIGFLPGMMTAVYETAEGITTVSGSAWGALPDGSRPGGYLGLLILATGIGAVCFRVTGRKKPLEWVIVGTVCASALYWLAQYRYTDVCIQFHIGIFLLLICELILGISYKIGQRFSIFV